jgi:hypothetical protein
MIGTQETWLEKVKWNPYRDRPFVALALGWQTQRFDTDAGPLDVVPQAAAIGGFEEVATVELQLGDFAVRAITLDEVISSKEKLGRPKDIAALPALYAAREAVRQRRESNG